MSNLPTELKYATSHEWIRQEEGDIYIIGITDHAQEALGDIVFVEPAETGDELEAGDAASVVESVKAASDIFAPVAGEIVGANEALEGDPALVNTDPHGNGWIFKMKVSDVADVAALMDADAYNAHIGG